jgi:hypothetical protein
LTVLQRFRITIAFFSLSRTCFAVLSM